MAKNRKRRGRSEDRGPGNPRPFFSRLWRRTAFLADHRETPGPDREYRLKFPFHTNLGPGAGRTRRAHDRYRAGLVPHLKGAEPEATRRFLDFSLDADGLPFVVRRVVEQVSNRRHGRTA